MSPSVLIRAGNFWDGMSDTPSGPMEILVQGDRIAAVNEEITCPPDTNVIDLSDHTVTPGFIDCHVHLTFRPGKPGFLWNQSPAFKTILGVQALKILLMRGFTTVRDCGDMNQHGNTIPDLARAVETGMIQGPRVVNSGHIISARGGHMDITSFLPSECHPFVNCLADGADEIRRVVRQEINRGATWIKCASSGGFTSPSDEPGQVTYSQEEMNVLVETAKDFLRPVSVHAIGEEGIRRAVIASVRSVEHGCLAAKDTVEMMEKKGIFVVPTYLMLDQIAVMADEETHEDSNAVIKFHRYREMLSESVETVVKSRVKIAFGTDIGCYLYEVQNAREFSCMVQNGIEPVRALRAATGVAAELLMRDDIGILAPGRYADIVAMPGDPFDDICLTEKTDFVMKGGRCYKRGGMSIPRLW